MAEKAGYSTVKNILILQASVIVFVSLVFLMIDSVTSALSSIYGGLTAFLPNLYFAYRIFLVKEQSAKQIVRNFYTGERRKFLLTCALFALVFQVPEIQFFPLMACFTAVLSVFWLALILFAQEFEI